ncbi:MAG: hypothetical protein EHM41_17520, partial [Chloroflexi bacterium]
MSLDWLVQTILHSLKDVQTELERGESPTRLGLRRPARLPVLAALYKGLNRPLVLLTERADQALVLADELGMWLPDVPRLLFPEP